MIDRARFVTPQIAVRLAAWHRMALDLRMPSPILQGSKPGLLRQLGFFSATALVISNMVGTGIFATTGFMAGDLGSAG